MTVCNPGATQSIERLDQFNILADLGPLYHSYAFFNVENVQLPGKFTLNQQAKAPIITAYIAYALAKSKTKANQEISMSELFCADGYYAMVAARLGCTRAIGIDNNKDGHFARAEIIAKRLALQNVQFLQADITPYAQLPKVDIVANVGGLYHVDNPEEILKLSLDMAEKFLIVQSVVSLANQDPDYYASPAPGWDWGNRYSAQSFDKMVKRICPKVIDSHFNQLEGNKRLEDRGSLYYLIQK